MYVSRRRNPYLGREDMKKEVRTMPYQKYYSTSHTTQLSVKGKFKSAAKIASANRHNKRIGREGQGVHIDKRREGLNRDLLGGKGPDDIYLSVINRATGEEYTSESVPMYGEGDAVYYRDGKKIKEGREGDKKSTYDTVLAFETEARYPGDMVYSTFDENGNVVPVPDGEEIDEVAVAPFGQDVKVDGKVIGVGKGYFLYPTDMKEFREWCESTLEFQKRTFGEKNILSARVHMDENTPHIHTICAPFVEDKDGVEKLSYRKMVGGRAGLFEIQNEYAVSLAHLGYKRGEVASIRTSQISTKEYKAGLNRAVNAEYPKDMDAAKMEIRNLRAENYELKTENRELVSSAKTIQKLRISRHDLSEENKRQKEEIDRLRKEAEQQRRVIEVMERKEQIEKKGQEIHPNQEAVSAYQQLREQFMEMGKQYYKDLGYNVDLKYYEDRNHDGINDRDQTLEELGDSNR